MMARTQITMEPEIQRRVRRRAADLGISLAEYVRRLVERDLGSAPAKADPSLVFDLGKSGGSDIATNKDSMLAEAVGAADLEAAWQMGVTWRDQDCSIVDRTCFAVMRRLGIDRAASFDADFAIYRFGPNRRHAFTIVR